MESRGSVLESEEREAVMSDVLQMRLALAGFLEEMAGRGFGPSHSSWAF